MRWSLKVSSILVFLLVSVCFKSVFALPIPSIQHNARDRDSLFARFGASIPKWFKSLKASSKVYRHAATQHPYVYSGTKRMPTTTPHKLLPGHEADHLVEHQTVVHALKKIGHTISSLPPTVYHGLKKIFNHPKNVVLIPQSMNGSKGQATKQGLAGKKPTSLKPGVVEHTKATKPLGIGIARWMDETLHSGLPDQKIKNVIEKSHRDAGSNAGLFRRELIS
jgi:hypothetical protein